ncbi:hypothetical protein ASC90_12440 [Rhizobium sp. Root1220]|nr:hypothetical protein ASC90_12440 [Rhizobium sp. Root1220]
MHHERWSIVDEATQSPVRLDGVSLSAMSKDEARQMLKVLRGIDAVRSASTKAAAFARRLGRQLELE